ncbi:MAG: PHP domain-containing protein [Gemmatimonadota bacterium]
MDLDLHLHSSASDGTLPPEEVVALAVSARLDVIALTDHDTVQGVAGAIEAARQHPIAVIPALEISTTWDDSEFHILGYFIDPTDQELVAHVGRATQIRLDRLRTMVSRLADRGIEVPFDQVEAVAGTSAPGRPHLARAMVDIGIVQSVPEAFDRFIGNDHPAYLPTRLLDPEQAIRLIQGAGGLAVWAHPPVNRLEALLPELRRWGLAGLEVYRPYHSRDRMLQLERAARSHDLMVTGGSDWHGPEGGELGSFRVQASEVAEFLEAGGM